MLHMDEINYIRKMDQYEDVSVREISRRTGKHFNTVKKYIEMEDFNETYTPPHPHASLLDPLKPTIDKWLEMDMKVPRKQRHTVKRIYDRLQEEYPEQLEVKLRTVQYYVSTKKKELYEEKSKGYIPLQHPPGEAQVDFGEFMYYDNTQTAQKGYNLTVSFPYSNAAYCQSFKGQNQECLLQGLKNIFEYMELVPHRMVFDNLSAAVISIEKDKSRKLTDGFTRFANHYGFEAAFCNPRSGWEKGNVEGKVGYERRNFFVPVPSVTDFDKFNNRLFESCDKDMNRKHYKKEFNISTLFTEDRAAMLPLSVTPYNVAKLVTCKSDKYGKVMFESNKYSTSPALALSTVYLEINSTEIIVMDPKYNVIITHTRFYSKGNESMKWQPYIALMARRPKALKFTSFYNELPDIWQDYFNDVDEKTKRETLNILNIMLQKHSIAIATDALSATLVSGVKDSASILASYQRITKKEYAENDITLGSHIPSMPSYSIDASTYDALLEKKVSV